MHIVMLSDQETDGGAAVAASRLARGLAVRHRVSRCVLFSQTGDAAWHTEPLGPSTALGGLFARLTRGLRRRFPRWLPRPARDKARRKLQSTLARLKPDVINVHNLHAGSLMGWSADLVRACAEFAPVVWTLHDMWSFTGRCAYSYDCRLFETGCSHACPTPHEYPQLEAALIRQAWDDKRRLFQDLPGLTAVSPSRWLADEARRGFWGGHRVEVIPNSLPLETFRPMSRSAARWALRLDSCPGPIILVSAHLLTDRRKGGDWLGGIWKHVARGPITLLTLGHGRLQIADQRIHVAPLGYLRDPEKIVLAYNAADVVLHAAPVDNLPNVAVEAIACGTPVIGMPIGGVPEIIKPGVSGWLARQPTMVSLAEAMTQGLDSIANGQDLRSSSRAFAQEHYATEIQAIRYERLFAQMSERKALAA